MIRLVEARNFRMLRANRVSLTPFQVLVGPNATGKTTFLDVLQFIADVVNHGVAKAVEDRSPSFHDLCYDPTQSVALAVEVEVGNGTSEDMVPWTILRHEIEIGITQKDGLRILQENLFILPQGKDQPPVQPSIFGTAEDLRVIHSSWPKTWRRIAGKTAEGRDYFQDEKTRWNTMFRFGVDRSAFGSVPEDPERFPLSLRAKTLIKEGIQHLALEPRRLRAPAPPGGRPTLGLDGSNLPYVVRDLAERDPVLFSLWKQHISTAVSGLMDVMVTVREDDKYLVLSARFGGEHSAPVPSWLLSDGTLRLMALSILSYAARPDRHVVYLVEEPENGLHPLAVQAVFDALASPGTGTQWLCATHSPVFLAHVTLDNALVFRRGTDGTSQVMRGPEVAELTRWSGKVALSDLFATGVLS